MPTTIYDVLHVLFKRKRIISLALVLVFGPAIVAVLMKPAVYRAAGRLQVTQARAYPQLSPQPDNRNVPINDVRLLAATAQSLRTRSFLREVGNALAANGKPNGSAAHGITSGRWWTGRLLSRLEVIPDPNAPLIQVAYRAADPKMAARIINTVVDQYVGYQARAMFDNPALRSFYETRRNELERYLQEAELTLTRFQEENQIFALEEQKIQLARAHTEAIKALDLNAGHIRQAEAEAKALAAQLQKLPAQLSLHTYGDNPRLAALNGKVVALELELNDLRQLYTDEDRRVKSALERLAMAQDMLATEEAFAGQVPSGTRLESNDAYQNILENSLRQEAAADALRARREELADSTSSMADRLQKINRLGYEYERLKAERDAKQVSYGQFLTLLEQARSSEAMDRQGLTNVRIVDRAEPPAKPLPSRRWLTLAMAFLTSLTIGIAGAFGLEALSSTVHGARDGEQRLALPVVAVIPEDR
jgi:uncharacterized protein involved in exopolysaccharide biosynthesis